MSENKELTSLEPAEALVELKNEHPLMASVTSNLDTEQQVILTDAIKVAAINPDIIGLAQQPLTARLITQNNGDLSGEVWICDLNHNGKMGKTSQGHLTGTRLSIKNEGLTSTVSATYNVQYLIAKTEGEIETLKASYIQRANDKNDLPDKGITYNNWGGIDLSDEEATTKHILDRILFYFFVLGDGKAEGGWSPYGDSLENSELFHPVLLNLLPIEELVQTLQQTYAGVLAMDPSLRETIMQAIKADSIIKIKAFIQEHKGTIQAISETLKKPDIAARTLAIVAPYLDDETGDAVREILNVRKK